MFSKISVVASGPVHSAQMDCSGWPGFLQGVDNWFFKVACHSSRCQSRFCFNFFEKFFIVFLSFRPQKSIINWHTHSFSFVRAYNTCRNYYELGIRRVAHDLKELSSNVILVQFLNEHISSNDLKSHYKAAPWKFHQWTPRSPWVKEGRFVDRNEVDQYPLHQFRCCI